MCIACSEHQYQELFVDISYTYDAATPISFTTLCTCMDFNTIGSVKLILLTSSDD